MNTPNDITQKLMQKADSKLRLEIDNAARPLFQLLNDGSPHRFVTRPTDRRGSDIEGQVEVYFRESFSALKELAFTVNQKRYQEAEINSFITAVENLESQLDELRQSIPN